MESGTQCTERIDWAAGQAGFNSVDNSIMSSTDIGSALITAIGNTTAETDAAVPIIEPNFWIKAANLKYTCVNNSQTDCWVWAYPYVARYDNTAQSATATINLPTPNLLEAKAFAAGTLLGNMGEVGFTPFQNRGFCECFKLLRPRKVFLQGGQSYTFTLKLSRPFHVTYGRLGGSSMSLPNIGKITRGILIHAEGIPVSDSGDDTDISPSFGALDCYWKKTYEWVSAPMPHHYSDFVSTFPTINIAKIIQPQTGAIVTGATTT